MRFRQFKPIFEVLNTSVSADHLEGLKDVIARRIKMLPDDDATAKALKEIEDLLQHVGKSGGRIGAVGNQIDAVDDSAVKDAKKVLARLVLSIAEEVNATPEQKEEFFRLWREDKIVNVETIIDPDNRGVSMKFADIFNGYASNKLLQEFVDEVMSVSDLGMGRGEFGLNVLSKSITVSKGSKKEEAEEGEGAGKKGDLQFIVDGKRYQIELKTESGGAARFGDQEVRPAEGFEAAAIALNNYVKKHKMYNQLDRKLSGSGMNINQVIQFHQLIPPADKRTFLGLVRNCLNLIFGNIQGGRKAHLARLKRNVNEIMAAVEVGDNGAASQAYSQASFNFYMSRKHDDGVLYTNLNNKTFVYYDDAAQLLAAGLRFHATTFYISATKDPVRSVYPQLSVQSTTFGGAEAQKNLKQLSKGKNPLQRPDFAEKIVNWANALASRRNVTNSRIINGMISKTMEMIQKGTPTPDIIPALEKLYPQLQKTIKTNPKITSRVPPANPTAKPATFVQPPPAPTAPVAQAPAAPAQNLA